MPLPNAIYRRLDFGINISNEREIAPSHETTENPDGVSAECSSGRKRMIEDVLSCENVEISEVDMSGPLAPDNKAARRSPRLAIKSLKNLLSKRRNKSSHLPSSHLPDALKILDEGHLTFVKKEFLNFVREADLNIREYVNERSLKKHKSSFLAGLKRNLICRCKKNAKN